MILLLINNKLYLKVVDHPQQLKEIPLYTLAGKAIKDIYKQETSIVIEIV